MTLVGTGFPIRVSPDQSLLAAPRSFSQLSTPFIGIQRPGIHRMLFVACTSFYFVLRSYLFFKVQRGGPPKRGPDSVGEKKTGEMCEVRKQKIRR